MKRFKISLAVLAILFAVASAFTSVPFSLSGDANTSQTEPPVYDLNISDELNNAEGETDEEKVANYADEHCRTPFTPVCFRYSTGGSFITVPGSWVQ